MIVHQEKYKDLIDITISKNETDDGYSYMVGFIFQPYNPKSDGNVIMTREEALEYAYEVAERLISS